MQCVKLPEEEYPIIYPYLYGNTMNHLVGVIRHPVCDGHANVPGLSAGFIIVQMPAGCTRNSRCYLYVK